MSSGLDFCASVAGGIGSIPSQGTKIPHAMLYSKKKKKRVGSHVGICMPTEILWEMAGRLPQRVCACPSFSLVAG